MSFDTFSLPEDRCVRLLIKNLGRQMSEDLVRLELETGHVSMETCSSAPPRREQDASKARPSTPHYIVSVAWGSEVEKLRALSELRDPRVSVETYIAPKCHLQASAANASAIRSDTAVKQAGALLLLRLASQGRTLPQLKGCSCKPHRQLPRLPKEAKAAIAKRSPVESSEGGGAPKPSCRA